MTTALSFPKKSPLFVGVDLAKSVFQVAYQNPKSSRFCNRQLTRKEFRRFLTEHQGSLCVGMEACGSAHYWGRECVKMGHEVRILPAITVKYINQGNKDDRNDAHCIWQAMHLPSIKTVKIRDESNQALMSLLKLRDLIIKQKTQLQNNLRGCFYEQGVICGSGSESLIETAETQVKELREENKEWSELIAKVSICAIGLIKGQAKQLQTIDEYITKYTQENESCRKLMTIPYVGPVTAVALYAVMFDPGNFKNARQFAAYAGFVPTHTGTGGRITMGGIPLKGNPVLKRVLYQACLSLYSRNKRMKNQAGQNENTWLARLSRRLPVKKTVCAAADKICRIAWALLHNGECYADEKSTLGIAGIKSKRIMTRHMYDSIITLSEEAEDNKYNR